MNGSCRALSLSLWPHLLLSTCRMNETVSRPSSLQSAGASDLPSGPSHVTVPAANHVARRTNDDMRASSLRSRRWSSAEKKNLPQKKNCVVICFGNFVVFSQFISVQFNSGDYNFCFFLGGLSPLCLDFDIIQMKVEGIFFWCGRHLFCCAGRRRERNGAELLWMRPIRWFQWKSKGKKKYRNRRGG